MKIRNCFILCIIHQFLFSCANPVGPTGGEKDTKPPTIVKIDTLYKDNKKYISLYFDENIQFKNNVHFVPYSKITTNQIIVKNKTITLQVHKDINAISLNESITDANENNLGHYPYIILGKDTSKQIIYFQHPLKDNKIKIRGYSITDTLIYRGDNPINNAIRFEALKSTPQIFNIYSDINNNEKLDDDEFYYTKKMIPTNDTLKIKLYPPSLLPVYINNGLKDSVTIYISQNPLFNKTISSLKFILNHLDTFILLKTDSTIIKNLLLKENITLKPCKTIISPTSIPTIYKNKTSTTDTLPFREYYISQLLKLDTLTVRILPHYNILKKTITTTTTPTVNKNIKKIGELVLQNDSFLQLTVLIIQNNKNILLKKIPIGSESIYLPVGKFQILAWIDQNNNNKCDHTDFNYERIIQYYNEFDVNEKLSNIYIIHKTNKPILKTNIDVDISGFNAQ
jgi:hypothetical protein